MADSSDFVEINLKLSNTGALLNQRRKQKKFTDVQLKVGDKVFDAHRNVISLYSPVLKVAISDQWSTTTICPISDEYVDPEIVDDLLNFLYTGYFKLTPDNVHSVCMAVHFLQISTLLEPSVQYLCHLVTVENVLTLFKFSISCQLEPLRERCLPIIIDNYGIFLQPDQFLQCSFEEFNDVIIGLKEQRWGIVIREQTFRFIVRWTDTEPNERLNHLAILLRNIPLDELRRKFLTDTVSTHPLVRDSVSCQKEISSALETQQTRQNARIEKQNMIVISRRMFSEADNNPAWQYMSCYDSHRGAWGRLLNWNSPRGGYAATVINQRDIIVCGGYVYPKRSVITNSVEMFDWDEQTWKDLPAMPFSLEGLAIAAHKDDLYAIGCRKQSKFLTALSYSFATKVWKEIESCKLKRIMSFGHLISCKNFLYFIGGYSYSIVRYDPEQDQWMNMKYADLKETRLNTDCSAVSHGSKIHIFSHSRKRRFEVFDPESKYSTLLPIPPFSSIKSLVSMNDRLRAVVDSESVFEYNLSNKKWTSFAKIPPEFVCSSATVIAGHFH